MTPKEDRAQRHAPADPIQEQVHVLEEVVEAELPAVVTVSNEIGAPRVPNLRETMRAARKPVVVWNASDLGLEANAVGAAGSRAVRECVFAPSKSVQCEIIEASSPEAQGAQLAQRLREARVL